MERSVGVDALMASNEMNLMTTYTHEYNNLRI